MTKYESDLFVIVAYRILPKSLLSIPKLGSINLHGSLLPAYRGAAPIQWSLINGDKQTGLSTFFVEPQVDTGAIINQKKINIVERLKADESEQRDLILSDFSEEDRQQFGDLSLSQLRVLHRKLFENAKSFI